MLKLLTRLFILLENIFIIGILILLAKVLEVSVLVLTKRSPTEKYSKNEMSHEPNRKSAINDTTSYPSQVDSISSSTDKVQNASESILSGSDEDNIGLVEIVSPMASYERVEKEITAETFLKAMCEGREPPYLRGRDTTAKLLGVTPYKAKLIVKELINNNRIEVCGKKLKLCSIPQQK